MLHSRPATAARPLPTVGRGLAPRRAAAPRRAPRVARAAPSPDSDDALPGLPFNNPFRNKKKEDDARALLQDMFKDKGDPLSMYDGDGPTIPGARKKEAPPPAPAFDPKAAVLKFVGSLGAGARAAVKAVAALAVLAAVFVGIPLAKPTARAGVAAINWALRLDGAGPRARAERRIAVRTASLRADPANAALGEHELRALARFGPDA